MAKEYDEITNTVGDTDFGTSLKDTAEGDLSRGYYDASSPDGRTMNNNDGLRSEYEDTGEIAPDDDQRHYRWPEDDDDPGLIDRPGLNSRTKVRRN